MADFISPLNSVIRPVQEFFDAPRGIKPVENGETQSFGSIFTDLLATMNQTEMDDHASALQLASGDINDLASVLLDAEKADTYMRLTVQIRNKVVDAYNEIMRMSV